MPFLPYKHYLLILRSKSKSPLRKIIVISLVLFFIISGISSAFVLYQFITANPVQAKKHYVQTANSSFLAVKQSLDDVLSAFQVEGEKVAFIDSQKEASNSASASASGFFSSIDDLQKTLSKIDLAKKNIDFQKNLLEETLNPNILEENKKELLRFYDTSEKLMSDLYQKQYFAKEMVLTLGPDFYLPTLTNENIWRTGSDDQIKSYYQKTQKEAENILERLSKISPPKGFEDYYQTQTSYLKLTAKVANDIVKTLDQKQEENKDLPTRAEKAFEVLSAERQDYDGLSQKLLSEKLKIASLKDNLAAFAAVRITQNTLEAKLSEISALLENQEKFSLPTFLDNFLR